jgi:hypothetical protein
VTATKKLGIAQYVEVEPPASVDASLPKILGLVVFLRVERRMTEVTLQQLYLFEKCPANWFRSVLQGFLGSGEIVNLHRERFAVAGCVGFLSFDFMWAIISSAVSNGPKLRLAL